MSFKTEGNKTTVLMFNASQGERGEEGRRKGYRIDVFAGKTHDQLPVWYVAVRWGRAEQSQSWWQVQVKTFQTEQQAMVFAWEKYYAKTDKGYEVFE
jgi:hypothetical protein